MLHKVIIDQYRSFGSREEISLIPNMKRTQFMSHVYQDTSFPVLNHCVIVGGNASGKTNWVNAIAAVKAFCSNTFARESKSDRLSRWYYDNRFCMPADADEAPIHILIEFSYKGIYYTYSVTFDGEGVKMECLYKIPDVKLRPVTLAMRTRDLMTFHTDFGVSAEVLEQFHKLLESNPNSSFLALNAQHHLVELDFLDDTFEWFNEKLEVMLQDYSLPALMDCYCQTPQMLEFTNILLNKIGIGCNVVVKESDPNCWIQRSGNRAGDLQRLLNGGKITSQLQSYENDQIAIRTVGAQKVLRELTFISHSADGATYTLSAQDMSAGTLRLLSILFVLY